MGGFRRGHFYDAVPEAVQKLAVEGGWTEEESREAYWHAVEFPHWDFVKLMQGEKVFGWYGCEFDFPNALGGMDVLVDLGIIDDSDETFVNGALIGATGRVPNGSAWQADRFATMDEAKAFYLALDRMGIDTPRWRMMLFARIFELFDGMVREELPKAARTIAECMLLRLPMNNMENEIMLNYLKKRGVSDDEPVCAIFRSRMNVWNAIRFEMDIPTEILQRLSR